MANQSDPRAPRRRPTGWIVLTGGLLAAVIGLAIWAAVLQSDQDDVNAANAARIDELEQQNAELEQQAADLQEQLESQVADAEAAAAEAQGELDAARAQLEETSAELGAKGETLAESQAELERLAQEAEAALADADDATASARARARAQRARAELAEECLAVVADVLQRLYASDDPAGALEQAAEELDAIAGDCSAE